MKNINVSHLVSRVYEIDFERHLKSIAPVSQFHKICLTDTEIGGCVHFFRTFNTFALICTSCLCF